MAFRRIGCPPGFEQLFRFLVEKVGVKVFAHELQHGLSQLLVAAEIEDHIQGRLSGQTSSTVWDRGSAELGTRTRPIRLASHPCLIWFMLQALMSLVLAAVMWVQVPQWETDWSQCSVDVPDVDCHWYVVAPDNTFGEGFSWSNAPWFSAEGLLDIGNLKNTMGNIHDEAAAQA